MSAPLVEVVQDCAADHSVLLLPGLGGGTDQWQFLLPRLTSLAVNVGVGPSFVDSRDRDGKAWTVERLANAIRQELGERRWGNVVLVAHSVSAFVAMEIAASGNGNMAAVVLLNGNLATAVDLLDAPLRTLRRRPATSLTALRLFLLLSVPVPCFVKRFVAAHRALSSVILRGLVAPNGLANRDVREVLLLQPSKPRVLEALYVNRRYKHRLGEVLARIAGPVVMMTGDHDRLAPAKDLSGFSDLLANSTSEVLQGVGHATPVEDPASAARAIEHLLAARRKR
jgi:pimeloyl-ACP methyl ester carboxylesterase